MTTINTGVLDGVRRIGAGVRDLSVQGGIGGAPLGMRIKGATLSGAPVTGTWRPGDLVTDRTGKIWQCTAGGTPGTWAQAGATLDGTTGDIQPSPGTASAGSSSLGARADHVHPQPPLFAPGGLTGATAATRWTGATVSGPPLTGTWAVGDWVLDQSGAAWICVTAGTAPIGGQWRRAGDLAHQFRPESYGAKRDGRILTDVSITNGTAILTSPSAPFASTDVGKYIVIPSAGGFLNVPLVTTILSYQSATQVTLAANASRTVSTGGTLYGSDDNAAIQATINAAVAYAQSSKTAVGEVVFSAGIYCVAGTPGGTAMNAQLQLPAITAGGAGKVNLQFTGVQQASGPAHWLDPVPPAAGSVIASMYYNDSSSPMTPMQCVIGGPVTGYGGAGGTFSDMRVIWDGPGLLVPYRPSINGLDLFGVAQADIKSFSYFCLAQPIGASGSVWPPYIAGSGNPSPWQVFAYRSPTSGNNALNRLGTITAYGPYHGTVFADHFDADSVTGIYTAAAATAAGIGTGTTHHCFIGSLVSEESNIALYCPNDGVIGNGASLAVYVASCQVENASSIINDPASALYGEVRAESLGVGQSGGSASPVTFGKSGAANIRLVWDYQPLGKVATPPSVPGNNVAYTNQFWLDATVYVTSGGAAVSAIAVDGATTGATLGTTGTVAVRVRNGGTITLTYASTAPTWNWVLE